MYFSILLLSSSLKFLFHLLENPFCACVVNATKNATPKLPTAIREVQQSELAQEEGQQLVDYT